MSIKRFLESLTLKKAPGPSPSFTVFDILKLLEITAESGSIGRGRLSEKLGLGEGATRTLLTRLSHGQILSTSKIGCTLTERGRNLWDEIATVLPRKAELGKNELTFAAYNIAIQVKDRGERVGKGLEQRDAAVRAGARGTTTLVFKSNKLMLPTVTDDVAKKFPKAYKQIAGVMNLQENDVVIISCADNPAAAEYGALAAAWTIL